ncbi:hypothetical protein [Actinomadura logoneensis]|uniref:hypothetical protein n=1 Tax=Actinomadura logoneensis TaxID=2293572 RepID=UPI0038B31813
MPFQRFGARAAPACTPLRTALAVAPAARAGRGVTPRSRKGRLRVGRTLTIISPASCADSEARSVPAPAGAAAAHRPGGAIRTVIIKSGGGAGRAASAREPHRRWSRQTEHAHPPEHQPLHPSPVGLREGNAAMTAPGPESKASGPESTASGPESTASGPESTASGLDAGVRGERGRTIKVYDPVHGGGWLESPNGRMSGRRPLTAASALVGDAPDGPGWTLWTRRRADA